MDAEWWIRIGLKKDHQGKVIERGAKEGPFTPKQLLEKVALSMPPMDSTTTYFLHLTDKVSTSGTGRKYVVMKSAMVHLTQ